MQFVIKFIDSFLSIFFGPHSSTLLSSTSTSCGITQLVDENTISGVSSSTLGTTTSTSTTDALGISYINIETTQAYIESMNEEELVDFINQLENVSIDESPKTLVKTNNKNILK